MPLELNGMKTTCKYCGGNLSFVGFYKGLNYFSCSFCDLVFDENEVCEKRKRKEVVPKKYELNYFKPTKELLTYNTIELFHMLKECRSDWYRIFTLLKSILNNEPDNVEEIPNEYKDLYDQYIELTKKKFVIENIILEKAGFLPDKITDGFLRQIVEWGEKATGKNMYIYIKKDKELSKDGDKE